MRVMTAICVLVFTWWSPASSEVTAPLDPLVAFAIADFASHSPGDVEAFRNVRRVTVQHQDLLERPAFCGEAAMRFADGSTAWVPFASVATSDGFEQWLGASADPFCTGHRSEGQDYTEIFAEAFHSQFDHPLN